MSPIAAPPRPFAAVAEAVEQKRVRSVPRWLEPVLIWVVAFGAYFALGIWLTVHFEIIVGDAQARLLHAYYVVHNDPGKLTAIGFYWPPLQTLILIPFAVVRALGTSLLALPLVTAIFGGLLLVVVDRAFVWAGVATKARLALVVAFGLNPMVVFYASNGMAELPYLFLLTLALFLFVRWEQRPHWADMPLIGTVFALGVLSRYEVGFWLPVVALAVILTQARRGARNAAMESSMTTLLVPFAYALLLWSFLTWAILGNPIAWLTTLIPPAVPGQAAQTVQSTAGLRRVFVEQFGLFPLTFLLVPLLVAAAVRRQSWVGFGVAAALLVQFVSELLILAGTRSPTYLELRYNMRGIPVAMIALAWLVAGTSPRSRTPLAVCAVVAMVLTYPITAATMHASELGQDGNFVDALVFGQKSPGRGVTRQEKELAQYIRARIPGKNVILADDAITFGVILYDGSPTRYFDRIDFGDERWLQVRDEVLRTGQGVDSVRYLLVSRAPALPDKLAAARPYLGAAKGLPAWLTPIRVTPDFALYRVPPPGDTGSRAGGVSTYRGTPSASSTLPSNVTTSAPTRPSISSSRERSPATASRNRRSTSSFP